MRELLWATDIHLDHVGHRTAATDFGDLLRRHHPSAEGLIVTGDIAEARSISGCLRDLSEAFSGPVYFVLGNHDYYRGHFRTVDEDVRGTEKSTDRLHWLRSGPVRLDARTVLVGSDGFYDARYGDEQSPLQLSDFMLIGELFEAQDDSRAKLHETLRNRADELVERLEAQTRGLLEDRTVRDVIVATHVPPFPEAAWHDGRSADGTWAPYFSSKATGDFLGRMAREFPDVTVTTLCGHSHGDGVLDAAPNSRVFTGRATYGFPQLAGIVRLMDDASPEIQLFSSNKGPRHR